MEATPLEQKGRGVWRVVYGTALFALIGAGIVMAAGNSGSLIEEGSKGLRGEFFKYLPLTFGVFTFFSLLERLLPAAGPRKPLAGYWLNLKVHLLESLAGPILGGVAGALIVTLSNRYGWIDLRFSTGHAFVDLILTFLLSLFIYDFFFYWFHRFQHESFMWQEHKLHHMDEQLCAFSRESWIEPLLSVVLTGIPLAFLFKFNAEQGIITGILGISWNTFIHTNIKLHLGRFGMFLNGPQGHRIHHSRSPEHYDRNYAAFFPVWDVVFRTYHYPELGEYPATGVHDEVEVKGLFEASMLPLRGWRKLFRQWREERQHSTLKNNHRLVEKQGN